MYVATANGGVWRSDDRGRSWTATMDGFDTSTTAFAAASLCGGAIALDSADPDRGTSAPAKATPTPSSGSG